MKIIHHPPEDGFEDGLNGAVRIISKRVSRTTPSRSQQLLSPEVLLAFLPRTSKSLGNSILSEKSVTLHTIPGCQIGPLNNASQKKIFSENPSALLGHLSTFEQLLSRNIKELPATNHLTSSSCSFVNTSKEEERHL